MLEIITFIFLVSDLTDCRNTTKTARNKIRLSAGNVSSKIKVKLCQYEVTAEKSENNREKKFKNPDFEKSDKSILNAGIKEAEEATKTIDNKIIRLKIKRRFSLWIRFNIFSNKPVGGSI